MHRFPWSWIVAVFVGWLPCATVLAATEDGPRDWVRALRNGDKEALAHMYEAGADEEDFLREALRHREPDWRIAAAQRLGELQPRWAADLLRARVDDRHPGAAVAARLALHRMGFGAGQAPFGSLVYPGADLDRKESAAGALQFTLMSRDGTRNVAGFYERALADLQWDRLRGLGADEVPERCRQPWGGVYGRGPISFLVVVCGASRPGELAVIRLKVREAWAGKVLGTALERKLKDTGVR